MRLKSLYYSGASGRRVLSLIARLPRVEKEINRRDAEFDFLCACSGVHLSGERIARVERWRDSGIDWTALLRLAEHHGVLPLVARNLQTHAPELPADIHHKLRSGFDANLRRNLWFASELARIADHLDKNQLLAIPYKGPMLAESAYGDVALRTFGDLDFLISPTDVERAKKVLGELGYQPSKEFSPAFERFWLRNGYERSFDNATGRYLVELQWALLPRFYSVELRTDDLFARSRPASICGREVPGLSPEDSLLVLCLHAAKHLWMRLIWVCDIAETMRTQTVDWRIVATRARELGILRILRVSFWLAQRLLKCPLPVTAEATIGTGDDPQVPILGAEFAARLARGASYDFDSTEYFRLVGRLRERRRDRWRYFSRLVLTPGEGDLAAVRLPEGMFPLYRAVRAARLLRKVF